MDVSQLQQWGPVALVAAAVVVWLGGTIDLGQLAGRAAAVLRPAAPAEATAAAAGNAHLATIGKALEVRAWLAGLGKAEAVRAFDAEVWSELVAAAPPEQGEPEQGEPVIIARAGGREKGDA